MTAEPPLENRRGTTRRRRSRGKRIAQLGRDEARLFYVHLLVYGLSSAALATVNVLSTPDALWFDWPMLGWSVGLFVHATHVFAVQMVSVGEVTQERARELRAFYDHLAGYVSVMVVLLVIDVADGGGWWFFWPLLGWAIAVLAHAASVHSLPFSKRTVEEKEPAGR